MSTVLFALAPLRTETTAPCRSPVTTDARCMQEAPEWIVEVRRQRTLRLVYSNQCPSRRMGAKHAIGDESPSATIQSEFLRVTQFYCSGLKIRRFERTVGVRFPPPGTNRNSCD